MGGVSKILARFGLTCFGLANYGILVLITGCTAAEKNEGVGPVIPDLMHFTRWNRDCISHANLSPLVRDPHLPSPAQQIVDLFRFGMIMSQSQASRGHPRFSERLLTNARVSMGKQLSDLGAVFGGKRHRLV